MNKTFKTAMLTIMLFLIAGIMQVIACGFEFEVQGQKKEKYSIDDEIILKVSVTLTHRGCTVSMKDTKFDTNGLKITAATDWTEKEPGVWERKLKMKVTSNKTGKLTLSATRTCAKDGGFGSVSFTADPLK